MSDYQFQGELKDIAEVIGRSQTFILLGRLPIHKSSNSTKSLSLYVPRVINSGRWSSLMVEAIGLEKTKQLVEHFGGRNFVFSTLTQISKSFRNKSVVAQHAEGFSVQELAIRFELSERGIKNILKQ